MLLYILGALALVVVAVLLVAATRPGTFRIARTVSMRLQMTKPMNCDNVVEFTLDPNGADTTDVTWTMSGGRPFFATVMCLAVDMDDMCGRDFLDGLNRLKSIVEGEAPRATAATTAQAYAGAHAT
jgi:hypothetical protein